MGLALALALLAGVARADGFLRAPADLPLAPGLVEVGDAGVAFDSPGGRVVEAYAAGDVAAATVRDFYARTLPQLGWQPAGDDAWRREGERLTLELIPGDGALTVRFYLAPE